MFLMDIDAESNQFIDSCCKDVIKLLKEKSENIKNEPICDKIAKVCSLHTHLIWLLTRIALRAIEDSLDQQAQREIRKQFLCVLEDVLNDAAIEEKFTNLIH